METTRKQIYVDVDGGGNQIVYSVITNWLSPGWTTIGIFNNRAEAEAYRECRLRDRNPFNQPHEGILDDNNIKVIQERVLTDL